MIESEEERVCSAVKKGSDWAFHWIHRRLTHRRLLVMMVMAMVALTVGLHIQEADGDPVLDAYKIAVGLNPSNPYACKVLQDAVEKERLRQIRIIFFESLEGPEAICNAPFVKTKSTSMRYPDYIVANQAGTRIYTANFDSTVSTIDVATWSPIGTIQFPSYLDGGDMDYTLGDIAINPMGTRLYVLNTIYKTTLPTYTRLGNTVEVIDTEKNAVVASVPLGLESQPNDVVVDATGSRVYVTTSDIKIHDTGQTEFLDSGKVNVIDAVTNTIVKTISFSGQAPGPLVADPDGSRVYVGVPRHTFLDATQGFVSVPGRVSVIDTSQDRVTQTIDLEGSPRMFAINPTGTRLYVAYGTNDNFLEIIDTASNRVITKIDIPVDSLSIADIQVTS